MTRDCKPEPHNEASGCLKGRSWSGLVNWSGLVWSSVLAETVNKHPWCFSALLSNREQLWKGRPGNLMALRDNMRGFDINNEAAPNMTFNRLFFVKEAARNYSNGPWTPQHDSPDTRRSTDVIGINRRDRDHCGWSKDQTRGSRDRVASPESQSFVLLTPGVSAGGITTYRIMLWTQTVLRSDYQKPNLCFMLCCSGAEFLKILQAVNGCSRPRMDVVFCSFQYHPTESLNDKDLVGLKQNSCATVWDLQTLGDWSNF